MAGTVDLPGIGKVKSTYVWIGAGVVVVVVGWAYLRKRSSAGSAAAAAPAAATDPATGYPEGSAQDTAALAAQNGSGGSYAGTGGYAGTGSGYSDQQYYYDPADGLYDLTSPYTGSTGAGTSNTGPGTFTDDAYWVQYCEQNVTGYTAAQIQGALSSYLAGLGLTTTQMSIYQASLAVGGPPPAPAKTAAHLAAAKPPAPKAATVKVPNVAGKTASVATALLEADNLHPVNPRGTAPNAIVTATTPKAGTAVKAKSTVTIASKAPVKKK